MLLNTLQCIWQSPCKKEWLFLNVKSAEVETLCSRLRSVKFSLRKSYSKWEYLPYRVAGDIRDNGCRGLGTEPGTQGILGEGIKVAKAGLWSRTAWSWDPISHLAEWTWASHSTALNLSFFVCQMKWVLTVLPHRTAMRTQWDNTVKILYWLMVTDQHKSVIQHLIVVIISNCKATSNITVRLQSQLVGCQWWEHRPENLFQDSLP